MTAERNQKRRLARLLGTQCSSFNANRRLRVEALEDRRMLATFSVNNLSDAGAGSLREAMDLANADPMADTIVFSITGTISIASQLPTITNPVTINGPGAELLTIDAGNGDDDQFGTGDGHRIFSIDNSSETRIDVAFRGLTLTGGDIDSPFPGDVGGAIFSLENLTLSDSIVSGNSVGGYGGGIYSGDGTTHIANSTISDNQSFRAGGGIQFAGDTLITGSTFSANFSSNGGGISQVSGTATISNSTISGNEASFSGGGVASLSLDTDLTIQRSTIVGNSIRYQGRGGGVSNVGTVTIASSVLAGNVANSGRDMDSSIGTATLDGFNLIGDSSLTTAESLVGVVAGASDILATNDGTNPTAIEAIVDTSLSDNGGSTLTHRLMINSPAIDAGDPAMMSGGTMQFDQRGSGFDRIVGGRIDIGAVEVQSVTSLSCDFNQDGSCDATDINMLQANIVAGPVNPERFDLTNDGLVNVDDRNEWLALAGAENLASGNAYLLGDANLDGRVDVSDFNLWNSNKFNTTSDWTAADLNADGLVDVSDFNLWNSNKFRLSDSAARDSGHDDLNRREREDEYVRRNLIDLLFGDGARG